jgi:hypothetical protein
MKLQYPEEIFFDVSLIKTSNYPYNLIPSGSIMIDQASEDGDCTIKGFYDTKTGKYHIQEMVYNKEIRNGT